MVLTEGQLRFDFSNAIQAFKFDEEDQTSTHYHGLSHCMKAVDFIVERQSDWLFIEVKDYNAPNQSEPTDLSETGQRKKIIRKLKRQIQRYFFVSLGRREG